MRVLIGPQRGQEVRRIASRGDRQQPLVARFETVARGYIPAALVTKRRPHVGQVSRRHDQYPPPGGGRPQRRERLYPRPVGQRIGRAVRKGGKGAAEDRDERREVVGPARPRGAASGARRSPARWSARCDDAAPSANAAASPRAATNRFDDRLVLRERSPGRGVPLTGEGQRASAPGVVGTEDNDQFSRGDGRTGRQPSARVFGSATSVVNVGRNQPTQRTVCARRPVPARLGRIARQ